MIGDLQQHDIILALTSSSVRRSYADQAALKLLFDQSGRSARIVGGVLGGDPIPSFGEMLRIVDDASLIVAVDNGILALALALKKPCVAIFGPTDEHCIIWQFKRYQSMDNVRVIRSELPDAHCRRPCSFQKARGWDVKGKCSHEQHSDCLQEISAQQIFDFSILFFQQLNLTTTQ